MNTDDRWSWSEPSNEEFDAKRKTQVFYKLYYIKDGEPRTVYKFWAKNDDEALEVKDAYEKAFAYAEADELFYSTSGYVVNPDGTRSDGIFEGEFEKLRGNKSNFFLKLLNALRYRLPARIHDAWFHLKDTFHFWRHNHSMTEYWSLDSHMLEDLRHNIPLLIENSHGCPTPFCEEAREKLDKTDSKPGEYDKDVMDLAMTLWRNELTSLLEHVLLYCYYSDFGIVHDGDEQMERIERKYISTLPYKPGTYKEFDYEKLHGMAKENWNFVWDWIKENGEMLWD